MTVKQRIQPDEKVALKLTATERELVLEGLLCDRLKEYPRNRPVSRWMASLCRADDIQDRVTKDRFGIFIK